MIAMCNYYLETYLILTTYEVLFLYTNEKNWVIKGHTASIWQNWSSNLSIPAPELTLIILNYIPFLFLEFFIVGNITPWNWNPVSWENGGCTDNTQ